MLAFVTRGLQRVFQTRHNVRRLNAVASSVNSVRTSTSPLSKNRRAINDYDEAIDLNPQNASAYANRALTYARLGYNAQARRDTERAIELGFDRGLLESAIEEARRHR